MTETTERPLVTFAVIAYNQERFIREAIEGAFAQTYEPLEIILSDDCSPDRTFEIMQEMATAYQGPHKVVLNRNNPNLGLVPHIDQVMEMVSGEFIVINAGDDISVPERTEKLAQKWLDSGRTVKLVHSATRRMDGDGLDKGSRRPVKGIVTDPSPVRIIIDRLWVIGATAAWDRDVFTRFGPLGDGITNEDHIIPLRASIMGGLAYVPEHLVHHRTGGVTTRATQSRAYDYLYGLPHKARRWDSQVDLYVLNRFADVPYPGKEQAEAVCRDRAPILRFVVDMAELPMSRRWAMVPRAARLALRHRKAAPLKDWARYAFEPIYLRYANWRIARRNTGARSIPTGEFSEK